MRLTSQYGTLILHLINYFIMNELNAIKYQTIGFYLEHKYSISQIAQKVNKSYITVKRWIDKFQETGDLIKDRPRSGRPSKFSHRLEA